MRDVSATEAARSFSDLLDAVEHRGERFAIVRRGRAVAHLEPVMRGRGAQVKRLLAEAPIDSEWAVDLAATRELLHVEERP